MNTIRYSIALALVAVAVLAADVCLPATMICTGAAGLVLP